MARFKVTWARVVIMETVVDADSADDIVDDGTLPPVYPHGRPAHVRDVVDDEHIWEIEPLPS